MAKVQVPKLRTLAQIDFCIDNIMGEDKFLKDRVACQADIRQFIVRKIEMHKFDVIIDRYRLNLIDTQLEYRELLIFRGLKYL